MLPAVSPVAKVRSVALAKQPLAPTSLPKALPVSISLVRGDVAQEDESRLPSNQERNMAAPFSPPAGSVVRRKASSSSESDNEPIRDENEPKLVSPLDKRAQMAEAQNRTPPKASPPPPEVHPGHEPCSATLEGQLGEHSVSEEVRPMKRGRGRPPGSKTKRKVKLI